MMGVDHDKIILLSTSFPTIPMLGKNGCCDVIVYYVGNKRCCIVLYCIALHCIALHCIALHCIAVQCSAVQCSAVQCSAVQCSAVQCSAVQCSAEQCSAVQCIALYCTLRLRVDRFNAPKKSLATPAYSLDGSMYSHHAYQNVSNSNLYHAPFLSTRWHLRAEQLFRRYVIPVHSSR